MFKLLVLLLVTLVAGNGFNQVTRPWMLGRPAFRMNSSPADRPFPAEAYYVYPTNSENLNGQAVQDWPMDEIESRSNEPVQSNSKFFANLFSDEANIVQSWPFILDPFHFVSQHQNNLYQHQPFAALTRPAFARRTVSRVMTVTSTVITPVLTICVPSTLFATPGNPTSCSVSNRRRSVEDDFHRDFSPSQVSKDAVIPTIMGTQKGADNYEIESSKEEYMEDLHASQKSPLRQERRAGFRLQVTETSTVTVFVFNPTAIKKAITPVATPTAGQPGALLCIPPGLAVC